MNINYTDHLKLRLKTREIPFNYPELILKNPENNYYDNLENKNIAIKKLIYNGKLGYMMIAYESKKNYVEIITIHPISLNQIINRVKSRRWRK